MTNREPTDDAKDARPPSPLRDGLDDPEIVAFVQSLARGLAGRDTELAADLAQDTILVALREQPRDRGAMRSWLRSVMRNSLRNHTRRKARMTVDATTVDELEGDHRSPQDVLLRRDVDRRLGRALAILSPTDADIVRMRVVEGLPPRSVAAQLDLPVETVRTKLRRALVKLRQQLETEMDETVLDRLRRRVLLPLFGLRLHGRRGAPRMRAALVGVSAVAVFSLWFAADRRSDSTATPARSEGTSERPIAAATPSAIPTTRREAVAAMTENSATTDEPPGRAYRVRVESKSGIGVAGVDVFARTGLNGTVEQVGTTDERGVCRILVGDERTWVAARGAVGTLSDARLVEQPLTIARGEVVLRLRQTPTYRFDDPLSGDLHGPGSIETVSASHTAMTSYRSGQGLVGPAFFVPAWREGDGWRVVFRNSPTRVVLRDGTGRVRWVSALLANDTRPSIPDITSGPSSIRGRLVGTDGRPVIGAPVLLRTVGAPRLDIERATSGTDGSFQFDVSPRCRLQLVVGPHRLATVDARIARDRSLGDMPLGNERSGPYRTNLSGRVVGAPAELRYRLLVQRDGNPPLAIKLSGESSAFRGTALRHDGGFETLESRSDVRAIVLFRADGTDLRVVRRPDDGWPEDLEIAFDEVESAGEIRVDLPESDRPAIVVAEHRSLGLTLRAEAPSAGGPVVLRGAIEGSWDVDASTANGGHLRGWIEKESDGSDVDLRLDPKDLLTVRIDLRPLGQSAGHQWLRGIELGTTGRIVRHSISPDELAEGTVDVRVAPGSWRFGVGSTSYWLSGTARGASGEIVALVPTRGAASVDVFIPFHCLARSESVALLDAHGEPIVERDLRPFRNGPRVVPLWCRSADAREVCVRLTDGTDVRKTLSLEPDRAEVRVLPFELE